MLKDIIKKITKAETAYAHCDVPCGIYDPHMAQISAHTVLRMINLMDSLPKDDPDYNLKMSRYIAVKEEHGEILKHEVRIIWGDFMNADNSKDYPELSNLVWKIMKLGSAGRQTQSEAKAKELLEAVLQFSEIFWKMKGKSPRRVAAPYPTGGEIVLLE